MGSEPDRDQTCDHLIKNSLNVTEPILSLIILTRYLSNHSAHLNRQTNLAKTWDVIENMSNLTILRHQI